MKKLIIEAITTIILVVVFAVFNKYQGFEYTVFLISAMILMELQLLNIKKCNCK